MTQQERQQQIAMWASGRTVAAVRPELSPSQCERLVDAAAVLAKGDVRQCSSAAVQLLTWTIQSALDFYLANFEQLHGDQPLVDLAPIQVSGVLRDALDTLRHELAEHPLTICDAITLPDERLMLLLLWMGLKRAKELLATGDGPAVLGEWIGLVEERG